MGPLGIGWARMSGLVTLGTAFTDFLTVVARSGVRRLLTEAVGGKRQLLEALAEAKQQPP